MAAKAPTSKCFMLQQILSPTVFFSILFLAMSISESYGNPKCQFYMGVFLKWGYPQSSYYRWIFHEINQPFLGCPHDYGKPPLIDIFPMIFPLFSLSHDHKSPSITISHHCYHLLITISIIKSYWITHELPLNHHSSPGCCHQSLLGHPQLLRFLVLISQHQGLGATRKHLDS